LHHSAVEIRCLEPVLTLALGVENPVGVMVHQRPIAVGGFIGSSSIVTNGRSIRIDFSKLVLREVLRQYDIVVDEAILGTSFLLLDSQKLFFLTSVVSFHVGTDFCLVENKLRESLFPAFTEAKFLRARRFLLVVGIIEEIFFSDDNRFGILIGGF
jgi:hypothetical protein